MRLLIVEDNASHATLLRHQLNHLDYFDIAVATTGLEALRYVTARPFDLIITDWMMPGISGLDLTRRIRATVQGRRTPIILLTVMPLMGLSEDLLIALEAGVNDYIAKPASLKVLRTKIDTVMKATNA